MSRATGTSVENNFVKGLITEATGLNFPENAVVDCDNVVFDKTGSVYRRKGINYEDGYVIDSDSVDGVVTTFLWETVDNNGAIVFLVRQNGSYINFFEVDTSLSANLKTFEINLTDYKTAQATNTNVKQSLTSFDSGNGYLFLANKYCDPLYIEYDPDLDDITVNVVNIKIRDFNGIYEDVDVDDRPTSLTEEHEYNLRNQGWINKLVQTDGSDQAPLAYWDSKMTDFPSNSDIWWYFKDADQKLNYNWFNRRLEGNTPAPKGHVILNAFEIERIVDYETGHKPSNSAISGLSEVIETQSTNGLRPSQVAFYAGRVWWSGVQSAGFSGNLYFSKVVESKNDFGVCHQVNDPTSESLNDLLSTDGGLITIPDIAQVLNITSFGKYLVVIATNGIWTISGSDLTGFTADEYQINKISNIGGLSSFSVVEGETSVFWFSADGIYTIANSNGGLEVASLTNTTIKDFYDSIPLTNKLYAQGTYSNSDQRLIWLFKTTTPETFNENFEYDRALNFDLNTGAFYPDTYSDGVKIMSVINTRGVSVSSSVEIVTTTSGESVVDTSNESVVSSVASESVAGFVNKYLTHNGSGFTFSELRDTNYVDWFDENSGQTYTSYFVSGYRLRGESMRDFQSRYMAITSKTNANAGFLVSGRWDYSNSGDTKRFTTKQQGYKHTANTDYSIRKLMIRGSGRVLQFRVDNNGNKPFEISGWVTYDTVDGN